MSWFGLVMTSACAKGEVAVGRDGDGTHLSFTRSVSLIPPLEMPVERILTVYGRKTPLLRCLSATLIACCPVHTLLPVGTRPCIADCKDASWGLYFVLVSGRFFT